MEKPRLRGERAGMPSHLRRASYGPGLKGYQSGACIVRQARGIAMLEYIRPSTASSQSGGDARRLRSPHDVRWGKPDMGIATAIARA